MANPQNNYNSQEQDEISLFLQQILFHSSSSHQTPPCPSSSNWAMQSSVGKLNNESYEYDNDCESEETAAENCSTMPLRSCSKRIRAAEVHNLSEKRRRSKINEKMKALQSLIPNANKTDKASMLDEAIEYLKHLKQQVQMLTLRNGLNSYPICCLPKMRVDLSEQHKLLNATISMDSSILPNTFHSKDLVASSSYQDIRLDGQVRSEQLFHASKETAWPYDNIIKESDLETTTEHFLSCFGNTSSSHPFQ